MMVLELLMVVKENLDKEFSDGGKALKFRCFITKENSKNFQR